ncbi:DUF2000 domain-containing protein [Pseudonocardia sp. WMMC193]|uniref:DUF2000 domain-containing protein n=1 Tax=Pseudonocardia sp. WMMC193 TaxID=2911965 RepID=UPI001F3BCC6D|nr:DUF2000 domain-containing protein [Pseudonocardia sp. WMMC193]MCF7551636.1 DUF2000 domain-containing protein [Pseudonocardia sp. WMMC193]
MSRTTVGYRPEEIETGVPTRSARLKWVVVLDESLPAGRAANAAVCVAAATAREVEGLLGPEVKDSTGAVHPGLPWSGCTVLTASAADLAVLRGRAGAAEDVFVADMPGAGQRLRVYDEYVDEIGRTEEPDYLAVSVVGPRNRVAKWVKGFPLA